MFVRSAPSGAPKEAKVFIPEGTVSTEGVALSAPPGAPQGTVSTAAATEDLVFEYGIFETSGSERKAFELDIFDTLLGACGTQRKF